MRVAVVELDNGRIRYISLNVYNLETDYLQGKDTYIASNIDNSQAYPNIIKLSNTVYRDNDAYYLTEEHPLFNVPIIVRSVIKNKLDNNHLISHHVAGIRYLTKVALYAALAEYNKKS